MNQGEFYSSKEYNSINEYKHLPAETYIRLKEENKCGKEDAELGKELTTLHKKQPVKKADESKTLIDRIFGSIRGVATAATVAVTSVAVTTTFVTAAPQVELINLTCGDTYIEYEMEISGLDENGEYSIIVGTSNEEDKEIEIEANGNYQGRIEGLKSDWEYTLSIVRYDTILGEVHHPITKFQTLKHNDQQPIPPPVVNVLGVEISGLNEVQIYFDHNDVPENSIVEFNMASGQLEIGKITLTKADIEKGYVKAVVESSDALTITPIVTARGVEYVQTECNSYIHTFDKTLFVDSMVCLSNYNEAVMFYLSGITNGADSVHITASNDPGESEVMWLDNNGIIQLWYETYEEITYTLYLTNDNGDKLSDEVTVTVDTSVVVPEADYYLAGTNPSEIGITYNDDGTINMYIPTQFEADMDELYYQITIGDIRYTSRDKIARIEGIPNIPYAVIYDVCIDIDGKTYSIFNTVPSGMANEEYSYFDANLVDNVLTLQVYENERMHVDMNSIVIQLDSAGEEIILSEEDFVYNAETYTYDVVLELDYSYQYVVVKVSANPYYDGLIGIDDYKGSPMKMFDEIVYQS